MSERPQAVLGRRAVLTALTSRCPLRSLENPCRSVMLQQATMNIETQAGISNAVAKHLLGRVPIFTNGHPPTTEKALHQVQEPKYEVHSLNHEQDFQDKTSTPRYDLWPSTWVTRYFSKPAEVGILLTLGDLSILSGSWSATEQSQFIPSYDYRTIACISFVYTLVAAACWPLMIK